jgi:cytochrome c
MPMLRTKVIKLPILIALSLAFAGCSASPSGPKEASTVFSEGPARANVQEGLAIAETYCAACHAVGRTGYSTNSSAPEFRTLAARYPIRDLEEALAEGILVGHPAMPEFVMDAQQIEDFLAYLQSIQAAK